LLNLALIAMASERSIEATMRLNFNRSLIEAITPPEVVSPSALAYLGDAVYELYLRTYYLSPAKRLQDYHQFVVARVRAESQADFLKILEPNLTLEEQEILRKGRNAVSHRPRRLAPDIYQQATSLETLIGYLFLYNPQRLNEILDKLPLD
jgi:ribonuclease-3 family protein